MSVEPRWIVGCASSFGKRLAPFARVTRAQYCRALKDARRDALLSAAESCRERAGKLRKAADAQCADDHGFLYWSALSSADQWDKTALWLEKRADHPDPQPAREGASDAR